jgi:hypothetical protein
MNTQTAPPRLRTSGSRRLPGHRCPQPDLQRAAELQEIGVGVGRDIGRHGQRQQQQPFHGAAARKSNSVTAAAGADNGGAQGHQQAQPDGGAQIARQHGGCHLAQDAGGRGFTLAQGLVDGQPRGQHGQHRQVRSSASSNSGRARGREGTETQEQVLAEDGGHIRGQRPTTRPFRREWKECKCKFYAFAVFYNLAMFLRCPNSACVTPVAPARLSTACP